jgi:hypothetical protein
VSEKYIDNNAYASTGYTLSGLNSTIAIGPAGVVGAAAGSSQGGTGGAGIRLKVGAGGYTLLNKGKITGGAGGYSDGGGDGQIKGFGGAGVYWGGIGAVTNSTGAITGGLGGSAVHISDTSGAGGAGVQLVRASALRNGGHINGGAGGSGYGTGGQGGVAILAAAGGAISNTGSLNGGAGGESYQGADDGGGGDGGAAVSLGGAGLLTNSGTIAGGVGGVGFYSAGGAGGAGIVLTATGRLVNRGLVKGGAGGFTRGADVGPEYGRSGVGVVLAAGGSIVNGRSGKIEGGKDGAYAADGILASGAAATITNFGTIVGFYVQPAENQPPNPNFAVQLTAASDRFIAEAGSVVSGQIAGGGGTMEFAGGRGTITGVGSYATTSGAEAMGFSGFGAYIFDSGAVWTLAGANTLSSGQTLRGGAHVTLSGDLEVASGGAVVDVATLSGATLTDNGTATFDEATRLEGTLSGGGVVFERGAATLAQSGDASAFSGTVVISGGTVRLANATGFGTAEVRYDIASSILALNSPALPANGGTFAEILFNFDKTGEGLDLLGRAYVSGATATLSGHNLTLVDGHYSATFTLSGTSTSSYASSYLVTSDGTGGTLIEAQAATPLAAAMAHAMATFAGGHEIAGGTSAHVAGHTSAVAEMLKPR